MTTATATATAETTERRAPDILIEVIEWVGEPRATNIDSRTTGEPKIARVANVLNKHGAVVRIEVLGTAKQWEYASDCQAEGYLSKDGKTVYFQPHLTGSAAPASQFI